MVLVPYEQNIAFMQAADTATSCKPMEFAFGRRVQMYMCKRQTCKHNARPARPVLMQLMSVCAALPYSKACGDLHTCIAIFSMPSAYQYMEWHLTWATPAIAGLFDDGDRSESYAAGCKTSAGQALLCSAW